MLAAGIDLSGRTTGTTAVAWVVGESPRVVEVLYGAVYRDDRKLADALLARRPDVVAVDAPLALPHAVVCRDPCCTVCFPPDCGVPSYGSRAIDGPGPWAAVGHTEKSPMPTVMVAGIAFRAIYLSRMLPKKGLEMIETWPMGVYRALARRAAALPAGADGGSAWRRALLSSAVGDLERVCPPGEHCERDMLDAVAAAYAGWCKLAGAAVHVQAEEPPFDREGSIWIPGR